MTTAEEWRRLHPRTVVVTVLTTVGVLGGIAVPVLLGFWRNDGPMGLVVLIAAGAIVVVSAAAAVADRVRWRHTTYRITEERVELRYAWVLHRFRSIPRERVRTVDLTANPLQRVFGLTKVKIGTGQQTTGDSSQLTLDPVDRRVAEELRRTLLRRAAPAATSTTAPDAAGDGSAAAPAPALAELDWAWLRYAPISVTTPVLGSAAFGAVMQVSEWLDAEGLLFRLVRDLFADLSIVGLVAVLVVIGVAVGVVGSLGLFVEMWYRYRLTREDGNLVVRRGLLTTRSLSLEQRRLRGVELVETFGARLLGAARVDVVATGLRARSDDEKSDPKTLLPSAPFEVARRVAADVLGSPAAGATPVVPHPRAARSRRLWWAGYWVLGVAGLLALLGVLLTTVLLHVAWVAAVVLTPVAIALALDSYRNLGHGLAADHIVTRYGAGSRRTVALVRGGVIGWTIRSSPFQRRVGLLTLAATTAANKGEYRVSDVGVEEGLRFAEAAVPGLLTPFLERRTDPAPSPVPDPAARSGP